MAIKTTFNIIIKDRDKLIDKLTRLLKLHTQLSELIPDWNNIEAKKLFNEIQTILSELIEVKAEK